MRRPAQRLEALGRLRRRAGRHRPRRHPVGAAVPGTRRRRCARMRCRWRPLSRPDLRIPRRTSRPGATPPTPSCRLLPALGQSGRPAAAAPLRRRDRRRISPASDAICTGLQLTNFWQDVAIDWRRGRVYLPQEDLARFGVIEAQIASGRCDAAWRALLAFETARARALLLEAGARWRPRLPWRLGLEMAGVIAGGIRILDAHRCRSTATSSGTDRYCDGSRLVRGRVPCVAMRGSARTSRDRSATAA